MPNVDNYKEQGGSKDVITGELDIRKGKLTGEIQELSVTMSVTADVVDRIVFIADEDYEVIDIREAHITAESTATNLYAQVERLQGTESLGNGDALLTDNSDSGISLKGTANTVVEGTVAADGTQQLDAGDRLGINISDTGTEIAGVCIQIELKRI